MDFRVYKKVINLFKMVYGQPYLSLGIEHTTRLLQATAKLGWVSIAFR